MRSGRFVFDVRETPYEVENIRCFVMFVFKPLATIATFIIQAVIYIARGILTVVIAILQGVESVIKWLTEDSAIDFEQLLENGFGVWFRARKGTLICHWLRSQKVLIWGRNGP